MSIQELKEVCSGGVSVLLILSVLIQIAPIKINPWSSIAKWIGNALNADLSKNVDEIKEQHIIIRDRLDEHIRIDNERHASTNRSRILRFNTEILEGKPHTQEDWDEILEFIDYYERYCEEHHEYKNNKAVHAITNIERVYDEKLRTNDFLKS